MRTAVSFMVVLSFIAGANPARAGGMDTTTVACGAVQASWNAPKGAIVGLRRDGTVSAMLEAVGEYRTHVMMSHGVGGSVTHAMAHDPGVNDWPTLCSRPLRAKELEHGYPGASRIDQGGAYTVIHGPTSPVEHIGYTIGADPDARAAAEAVADTAWYDMPAQWLPSRRDPSQGFYLLSETGEDHACDYNWYSHGDNFLSCPSSWRGSGDGCDCGCQWTDSDCGAGDFQRLEYSNFQYHDVEQRHRAGAQVRNNGVECASLIALLYNRDSGDVIAPHTYAHDDMIAGAVALYNDIEDKCADGLGTFGRIATGVACFENICDDAARQARNCFIDPSHCDSDSEGPWRKLLHDPSATATTISPDKIVGASGHAGRGQPGAGPWSGQPELPLTWNSGGNVYGCWF